MMRYKRDEASMRCCTSIMTTTAQDLGSFIQDFYQQSNLTTTRLLAVLPICLDSVEAKTAAEAPNLCSWVWKDSQHGHDISAPDHANLVAERGTSHVESARCVCAGFRTRPDGFVDGKMGQRGKAWRLCG